MIELSHDSTRVLRRARTPGLIAWFALTAAVGAWACSSGDEDSAASEAEQRRDAIVGSFEPASCAYAVPLAAARGYVDPKRDRAINPSDVADATPLRVRLGLGGDTSWGHAGYADPSTSAAFVWETPGSARGARVEIGTSADALDRMEKGFTFVVPAPESGWRADDAPLYMHEVHVCGLEPETTYYYRVGGGKSGAEVWSEVKSFTTMPASGEVTFGIAGDSRDDFDVLSLVQDRMKGLGVDMQLFSGDLIKFGNMAPAMVGWLDAVDHVRGDPTRKLTLGEQLIVPVPGNHEKSSAQFYGSFALPGAGDSAESYASFDVGSAHVILLDDEAVAKKDAQEELRVEQLAWLERDLEEASKHRDVRPFIIAVHHRGEYSTSDHGDDTEMVRLRERLVPLWHRYGVDLVIGGHDHNYERTHALTGDPAAPLRASSPTTGTTYVICAGAGAHGYAPGTGPSTTRAVNAGFGEGTPYVGVYGTVQVTPQKLTLTAYGLKQAAGSSSGDDVLDTFEIDKSVPSN